MTAITPAVNNGPLLLLVAALAVAVGDIWGGVRVDARGMLGDDVIMLTLGIDDWPEENGAVKVTVNETVD